MKRRANRGLIQSEDHIDFGQNFHRLPAEERGLITPLPHGIERGFLKERRPVRHLKVPNGSVLGYYGLQPDCSLGSRCPGERRVNGLRPEDQPGILDAQTYFYRTGGGWRLLRGGLYGRRWRIPRNSVGAEARESRARPDREFGSGNSKAIRRRCDGSEVDNVRNSFGHPGGRGEHAVNGFRRRRGRSRFDRRLGLQLLQRNEEERRIQFRTQNLRMQQRHDKNDRDYAGL